VIGVPQGGLRLAKACRKYAIEHHAVVLIVDDVLTTGASMEDERKKHRDRPVIGVVLFARGPRPGWVNALFECMVVR
jgi:pyrimidine operon attenuation protein/uracil phosphoribosyltransferase